MVSVENLADYLLEQIKTKGAVRISASEADYLDVIPAFPGRLEYHNGEIFAMSFVSRNVPQRSVF